MDLRKAYDSVPRLALWQVLRKYGIPPTLISIIKSLHEGMQAEVRVGTAITDRIDICNGLQQGCVLAPTLFNLYFNAVVQDWKSHCHQEGVCVRYKIGRWLVGDRTSKSRLSSLQVTESQFADDVAYTLQHIMNLKVFPKLLSRLQRIGI